MAARRLLIVMLVLLGISSLAAALVGNRPIDGDETGSTIASETTESVPADTVPAGKSLGIRIKVGGRKVKVVPIEVGDQLALSVASRKDDLLEIPSLGLIEPVAPGTPAEFDILADEVASYGIRLVGAKRVVARVEVSARAASAKAKQPSKPAR